MATNFLPLEAIGDFNLLKSPNARYIDVYPYSVVENGQWVQKYSTTPTGLPNVFAIEGEPESQKAVQIDDTIYYGTNNAAILPQYGTVDTGMKDEEGNPIVRASEIPSGYRVRSRTGGNAFQDINIQIDKSGAVTKASNIYQSGSNDGGFAGIGGFAGDFLGGISDLAEGLWETKIPQAMLLSGGIDALTNSGLTGYEGLGSGAGGTYGISSAGALADITPELMIGGAAGTAGEAAGAGLASGIEGAATGAAGGVTAGAAGGATTGAVGGAAGGAAGGALGGAGGILGGGGGLLSGVLSPLLRGLTTPQTIGGLLTGAGGLIQGQQDVEARRQLAEQLRAAGQQAATQAQFRPVGITTRFGTSQFQFNPQTGQLESAGYTASPEVQALQNRLMGLSSAGLTQAEQAQAQFAPLTGAAQSLFGLGQQYLAQSPQEVAQKYMESQQALLQPERERQLASIQNRLQRTGRTGLAVAQGGQLGAANPELQAYYNALAQQNAQLAAQAQQAGQQQLAFGTGLFGQGAGLLGQTYAGQQAALAPFTQYLSGVSGLEAQAQQPFGLSANLGQLSSTAGARAGQLGLSGNLGAAQAMYPANAYSPASQILGGLGGSSLASGLIGQGLGGLFGGLSNALTNQNYYSQFGITPDVASIAI